MNEKKQTIRSKEGDTLNILEKSCIKIARKRDGSGYASERVWIEHEGAEWLAHVELWPPSNPDPWLIVGYGNKRTAWPVERAEYATVIEQLPVVITRDYPHEDQTLAAVTPHLEAWARHTCLVQIDAPWSYTADPYLWREDLHPLPVGARVESAPAYGWTPFTGAVSFVRKIGSVGYAYRVDTDAGETAIAYESSIQLLTVPVINQPTNARYAAMVGTR